MNLSGYGFGEHQAGRFFCALAKKTALLYALDDTACDLYFKKLGHRNLPLVAPYGAPALVQRREATSNYSPHLRSEASKKKRESPIYCAYCYGHIQC